MKKHFYSLMALVLVAQVVFAAAITKPDQIPSYYASVNGKSGSTLFDAIHTVAKKGYSSLSYSGLWGAYATTDVYPGTKKIWDMYSNCNFTYGTNQCGNYKGECDCYNREHSIPKSWFGIKNESAKNPSTDLFHIVPTDGFVNSQRSNWPFGEVSSASYTYDGSKLGSAKSITVTNTMMGEGSVTKSCSVTVFEPQDQYKGDFARMYMGTMLRWAGDFQAFSSDRGKHMFTSQYTAASHWGLTEYGLALLIKWHRQDPVSEKEIDRNNAVQAEQGNRNPFIDYPYLAEYIWGENAGKTVDMDDLMPSSDSEFIPGRSNGKREKGSTEGIEETVVEQHVAQKILINGRIYILVGEQMFTITGQRIQ